ncbi:histidine triad nucleotide-binding protein [Novacetimonas hansenii]|uniref:Histidine triad nucleotide-binding protein n=2 Tax=Novacetimonas hansenii TaxID=436 RepID=A0AAW5EVN6_NOVHA|nr:histidine triad nucleotide-binding protein [Novacetimonas hansenii]EFG82747.1 histidine triad (HIT) protein [Novacetimonas hansenii ATCC 23769]MBL7235150.1 histidine triad nucleotide-binding protein [Novacetimonas hansenii]MCJ8355221.1 histidine triad nucleotide-binding protein [Novacetimonas hansenii]PYD73036.1 histidine triad nucleotide-binding protein [Novacetimonas hansenii]QOF95901.1 histidine triad nucleotide-binding protein [Novacetimonas hansenii]
MAVKESLPYDPQNVFARILRGELPCNKVYENDYVLAFHDIAPKAPIHVLVIPKAPYVSFADFSQNASEAEITGFTRAVGQVARILQVDGPGYRLLSNIGEEGGQEVPHFHVHIFAGRALGPMLPE